MPTLKKFSTSVRIYCLVAPNQPLLLNFHLLRLRSYRFQYRQFPVIEFFRVCLILVTCLLKHKLPVLVEQLAVHEDFGVGAQVADEVPVDTALVFGTRFGVARAERHVEGAADLFIEQDLAGEFVDLEVGADGELAQVARARVALDHFHQVVLILGG